MSIKWMSQIWDNGPNDRAERFVLLALADFANDEGECWPSVESIARKTCMTERGCQKIIRRLEETGWLVIDEGLGRRNCNLYRLKNPERRSPPNTVHPEREDRKGERRSEKGERRSENPEPRSPEPSLTIKEPSRNRQGDFDAFWAEVPRKVGKEAARKAYASALKKTDHATIMAGIRRYAQERAGQDEKYTAHPASWLNAGRWDDVPASRQSFNDRLEGLFNELRIEGDDHRARPEQLPAPISDAGSPDGPDGDRADQADSGRYQQEIARFIAPRRFGGAAW